MSLPDRFLQLLALGGLLAALDLPLAAGTFPLAVVWRLVGVGLVVASVWALRPSKKPQERVGRRDMTAAASLAVLWGVLLALRALSGRQGGLVSPLAQASLLVALGLVCRTLLRISRESAWSFASRAWRRALLATVVCYGISTAYLLGLFLTELALERSMPPLTHPAAALLGPVWQLIPVVCLLLAVGWTSRDQAQLQREPLSPLSRFVAGRGAGLALLLILIIPRWTFEIPRVAHHLRTPTFAALVKDRVGRWSGPVLPADSRTTKRWLGKRWSAGLVVGEDEEFPENFRSKGHRLHVKLSHGKDRLLVFEREVLATINTKTGKLEGARVSVVNVSNPYAGFRVAAHTAIDLDAAPAGSAESGDLQVRVPFVTWVALLAGPADMALGGERVRGLPAELSAPANPNPVDSGLRLTGFETFGSTLPSDGEGLSYLLRVDGVLGLRLSGDLEEVPSRLAFNVNTDEYSYRVDIDETTSLGDYAQPVKRRTKRRTIKHARTWRGEPW